MKSFTCIAIEDEAPAIGLLESYLEHFPTFELKEHFTSALKARDYLKSHQVDVLFLDIQLPGISGMEFLKVLDNPPLVVITSAYDEHAIEAFGLEVFDYLLKPYSLARFTQTINRIEKHFRPSEITADPLITVKESWDYRRFKFSELNYIESQREYLLFFLKDGESYKVRMTMEEGMDLFPPNSMIRIHRSFIVPLKEIKAISHSEVTLYSKTLPLGRSYRNKVLDFWRTR